MMPNQILRHVRISVEFEFDSRSSSQVCTPNANRNPIHKPDLFTQDSCLGIDK